MIKRFTILAADGMAGFLDLAMGAFVAFVIAKLFGFTAPWWYLPIGAVLGFLPDLDAAKMMLSQGMQTAEGDHRLTVMHRPLIMMPACVLFAAIFGGLYWAAVTGFCLLWHYAHDSKWLGSVSDIDWFWPISDRELPYMDHPVWRETFWLVPSKLSIIEIALGTAILSFLIYWYSASIGAVAVTITVLWVGAVVVWVIHKKL